MARTLQPTNIRQQQAARDREIQRLRMQIRRMENTQQTPRIFRASPNSQGVDPGTI